METESQEKQIIEYLQSGRSLTAYQALVKFGCFRLASRVHRLKTRDGYEIKSDWVTTPGEKQIKRYFI